MTQPSLFPDLSKPSGAVLSPCEKYRYVLWRTTSDLFLTNSLCCFVMLNPSTADASIDDPTIRRCVGFARDWGYRGLLVVNLFAFRATAPIDLKKTRDPIGDDNDRSIVAACLEADLVVCAWGSHGDYLCRSETVRGMLNNWGIQLHHLGRCKNGQPRHPLYLTKTIKPLEWL